MNHKILLPMLGISTFALSGCMATTGMSYSYSSSKTPEAAISTDIRAEVSGLVVFKHGRDPWKNQHVKFCVQVPTENDTFHHCAYSRTGDDGRFHFTEDLSSLSGIKVDTDQIRAQLDLDGTKIDAERKGFKSDTKWRNGFGHTTYKVDFLVELPDDRRDPVAVQDPTGDLKNQLSFATNPAATQHENPSLYVADLDKGAVCMAESSPPARPIEAAGVR